MKNQEFLSSKISYFSSLFMENIPPLDKVVMELLDAYITDEVTEQQVIIIILISINFIINIIVGC